MEPQNKLDKHRQQALDLQNAREKARRDRDARSSADNEYWSGVSTASLIPAMDEAKTRMKAALITVDGSQYPDMSMGRPSGWIDVKSDVFKLHRIVVSCTKSDRTLELTLVDASQSKPVRNLTVDQPLSKVRILDAIINILPLE